MSKKEKGDFETNKVDEQFWVIYFERYQSQLHQFCKQCFPIKTLAAVLEKFSISSQHQTEEY